MLFQHPPYVAFVDQGVHQLQGSPPYADVSIFHTVHNGGPVALHSLRVYSNNLQYADTTQGHYRL